MRSPKKEFAHGVTVGMQCLLKTYEADAEGNSKMLGDIGMTRDPAGSFRRKPPGRAESNSVHRSGRSVFLLTGSRQQQCAGQWLFDRT